MDDKKHPADALADDNPVRSNYDWYEWVGKAEGMLRGIPALEAERDALRVDRDSANELVARLQEQVRNALTLAAPQAAQTDECSCPTEGFCGAGSRCKDAPQAAQPRCGLCNYQHGHAIGCDNNPFDQALRSGNAHGIGGEPKT